MLGLSPTSSNIPSHQDFRFVVVIVAMVVQFFPANGNVASWHPSVSFRDCAPQGWRESVCPCSDFLTVLSLKFNCMISAFHSLGFVALGKQVAGLGMVHVLPAMDPFTTPLKNNEMINLKECTTTSCKHQQVGRNSAA